MNKIKDMSIKNKLVFMVIGVTLLVTVTGFSLLIWKTLQTYKQDLVNDTILDAKLIGEYSVTALIFDDEAAAQEQLKILHEKKHIELAALFNADSSLFAKYIGNENIVIPEKPLDTHTEKFVGNYLHILQPVNYKGKTYGYIFVQANTKQINEAVINIALFAVLLLTLLLIATYFLVLKLQHSISKPILDLANITKQIADTENFNLKAEKRNDDEVGILTDSFNHMCEVLLKRTAERDRIFNLSIDMVCTAGMDGYLKQVNPAWKKVLGWTSEELLARPFADFLHPDDTDSTAEAAKLLSEGQPALGFENRYQTKDGSYRWLSWNTIPIPGEELMMGIARDITRQKEVNDLLRENEEKLRNLYESMAQGVTYQNADGEIIDANPAAQRILGLTLDQMQGKTSLDPNWKAIHEDGSDFPGGTHASMVALRTGKPIYDVIMGVFNPIYNDYRWIKIDAIPQFKDDEPRPSQVFTTFNDITEMKRAEQEVKLNEEKFRNIFENSMVGKSMTLMDGTLKVNRAFSNILGYTEEELTKISWQSITHPDDIEFSEQKIYDIVSGKTESARWEKRYIHKNGEVVWVDINTTLQKDVNGNPDYFITAIYDITERKYAEKDLLISELNYKNQANFLDTIIENSPFAMWISDANGYLIRVNQVLRDTLEIPADLDITKYNILEDENFSNQGLAYILDDVFKNHKSSRFEMFWLGPETGEDNLSIPKKLWVFGSMFPITDQNGKLINVIFQYVDITDRKRAEQELKNSEEKFFKIFQSSPNSIILTRLSDYEIVNANEATLHITGYALNDLIGTKQSELDVWKSADERKLFGKQLIENGAVKDFESEFVTKSGEDRIWKTSGEIVQINNEKYILGIIEDITEIRKQEQEILRQSEFINTMTEYQPSGIVACDADGKLILFNNAAKQWHGIDTMHISQDEWADHYGLYHEDGVKLLEKDDIPLVRAYQGEKIENLEIVIIAKGQEKRSVLCNGASFFDPEGNKLGAVIVMNDITEQKKQTLALQHSEEMLNEVGKVAKVGGWDLDLDTMTPYFTAETYRIYELDQTKPPKVEEGMNFYAPEAQPAIQAAVTQAIEKQQPYDLEVPFITAKGKRIWVRTIGHVNVENGKAVRLYGAIQDITSQKQAEQELKQSEEKYRDLVESSHDLIWSVDSKGVITFMNKAAKDIYGYEPEELIGKNFLEFVPKEQLDKDSKIFAEALQSGKEVLEYESQFIHKDGHTVYLLSNSGIQKDEAGNITGTTGTSKDITDAKIAEKELAHSHELMQYIIENSNSAVAVHDKDMRYVYVSQNYLDQYKIEKQNVIGEHHYEIFPDLPQKWRDVHQRVLKGEILSADEDPYEKEDGSVEWTRWECRPWFNFEGGIGGLIVYTEVITEQKNARDALKASEKKFRAIFENSLTAIMVADEQGNYVTVNKAAEDLFGFTTEEFLKMNISQLQTTTVPDAAEQYHRYLEKGNETGEFDFVSKDGNKKTAMYHAVRVAENFNLSVLMDITEKKQHLAELNELYDQLQLAIKTAQLGIWMLDMASNELIWNDKQFDIYGISREQFNKDLNGWREQVHPDDRPGADEKLTAVFDGQPVYGVNFRLIRPDGEIRYISASASPVKNENDEIVKLVGINLDITEIKQNEIELQNRNIFIQTILDNLPIGLAVNNMDRGEAVYINQKFEEIYGWPADEFKNINHFFKCVYPDAKYRSNIQKQVEKDIRSGDPKRMQWEGLKATGKNGQETIIAAKNIPLTEQNLMISTVMDITERIRYLNELEKSRQELSHLAEHLQTVREDERTSLARDLHDDFGQILTVMRIRISLIETAISDHSKETESALVDDFNELNNLLDQSMQTMRSLIASLRPEDLDAFGLIDALKSQAERFTKQSGINCHFKNETEEVVVTDDKKTAIYRLVQEALTNVLKHSKASNVDVFISSNQGMIEINIEDNGIGIKETEISKNKKYGLLGMRERVILMGGKFEIKSKINKGTHLKFSIPFSDSAIASSLKN